jgi:hypothetical protein
MTTHTGQSRGNTFAGYSDLEVEVCTCGVLFAAPAHMLKVKRENGTRFYCPNGHTLHYASENERLKGELKRARDREASERARRDQAEASLRATKGVVTRQRKRLEKVVAGVCPVDGCKRHFRDLRRHIESKHPEYHGQAT